MELAAFCPAEAGAMDFYARFFQPTTQPTNCGVLKAARKCGHVAMNQTAQTKASAQL